MMRCDDGMTTTTSDSTTHSTDVDDDDTSDSIDDETPETAESDEGTDSKEETTGPDPRLLEELDEHIRGARAAAEDALGGVDQSFVESGDEQAEDEDDQTIAPPG